MNAQPHSPPTCPSASGTSHQPSTAGSREAGERFEAVAVGQLWGIERVKAWVGDKQGSGTVTWLVVTVSLLT